MDESFLGIKSKGKHAPSNPRSYLPRGKKDSRITLAQNMFRFIKSRALGQRTIKGLAHLINQLLFYR